MAVPSNPRLSDVCTEFLAPSTTPLSAFVRGGSWVPNTGANAGVPASLPILLSQLAGSVRYVNVSGSASPTTINGAASAKGTFAIGTVTITGTGGTGSYTYGTATLISGTSSGPDSNISFVQTGNQYAFSATNVNINTDPLHGTWQVNVSDGTTNTNVTFNVNWN